MSRSDDKTGIQHEAPVTYRPYKRLGANRTLGELRSEVLYAVREILRNGSYDSLTIEQVAAKTDVSRRTLYNLFEDKDDIYRQTCESLIASVSDLVVHEIPERMSSIDGIRFYIASCIEVYNSAASKDLLLAVARDGARQAWLPLAYDRSIRVPLIRVCEMFVMKKSRRMPLPAEVPRDISVQISDIVKSMTIVPLVFNYLDESPEITARQIDIIAQGYSHVIDGKAGRI